MTTESTGRNLIMSRAIEAAPVQFPFRFVVAGDSGAWADPTADGIFGQLLSQVQRLDPAPVFFAHLGDFAGPGTIERHDHYLGLVGELQVPNICVVGNHDLDDPGGRQAFGRIHGPMNFDFAYGDTRFVVLHGQAGVDGEVVISATAEGVEGPLDEDLDFLSRVLVSAAEPTRIVLMHMPPYLEGHFAPHEDWGFRQREQKFLDFLDEHGVALVCCAHGLAFDTFVHNNVRFVMSGGGGTGLCSHYRGVCAEGDGHPEDRGSLFHAVEITVHESGGIGGRVIQAFDNDNARISFGPLPGP
ncbi:MAG: metallophosphoesterase [Actinomycetota bacterium]|nr:metallophosphoesterase [Actinomycetota bacterium]